MGTEREYGIRVADRHSGRTYLLALRGESQREVESAVAKAGWMVGPVEYEREAGPYTPTLVPPAPTGQTAVAPQPTTPSPLTQHQVFNALANADGLRRRKDSDAAIIIVFLVIPVVALVITALLLL
jgi:hypothetical protein